MYNYEQEVKVFLKEHFKPANETECNIKMSTGRLLEFIFKTFPKDCISDYELNDIMKQLGFTRGTFVELDDKEKEQLVSGWFLFSETLQQALLKKATVKSE